MEYTNVEDRENPLTQQDSTDASSVNGQSSLVPLDINSDKDDGINLIYLNKKDALECMSIPSHSGLECRMVSYVILWARRNNIKYEFDDFGNIYLTKGVLDEGEYYPCVTSHLDTVQSKHDPYIYAGVPLDLVIEKTKDDKHKLYVKGDTIGIGADDKSGICICLNMFAYHDKLKACFFLDEERGCKGSEKLWKEWFNDVAFVIGYDSPDLHRAAWSCQGTKLFSYSFYETYMKEPCDRWGLTTGCFFSEPYTDVKEIREQTNIICMNFGNGGYNAHNMGGTEYCVLEDMDSALGMGIDIIKYIGRSKQHILQHKKSFETTTIPFKAKDGFYGKREITDDSNLLEELGDNTRYSYSSYRSSSSSSSTSKTYISKESELKFETVEYVVNRYEKHINSIKEEVLSALEKVCNTYGIDYTLVEGAVSEKFNNEIKF